MTVIADNREARRVLDEWLSRHSATTDHWLGIDNDEDDEWMPEQVTKNWHQRHEHDNLPDTIE